MTDHIVISFDEAIRAEIRRELGIARTKYGDQHFELLCIEGSWGDTLDDHYVLRLLKAFNRYGSIYAEVVCRAD